MQTSRTAQQSAKRGGTLKTERIATGQVRSCPAKLNAQQRPQAAKDLRTSHPCKALGDVPKTSHPSPQGQIHLVGGRKGMEHSMTAVEAARLIDWLKANGHSAEEATECIKYIATGIQQPQQNQ